MKGMSTMATEQTNAVQLRVKLFHLGMCIEGFAAGFDRIQKRPEFVHMLPEIEALQMHIQQAVDYHDQATNLAETIE
jgi:hypothetical protein